MKSHIHCLTEQRAIGADGPKPAAMDRRQFLWTSGGGLGGIALAQLLGQSGALAGTAGPRPEFNGGLHHQAKAKRVVQLFMSGAASQCDMYDYKPQLIKRNGNKFDPGGKVELFQSEPGPVMQSPWDWKQYGDSGKWMSDLVPHLASCADDIAFLPSMISKSNVHGPATFMQNTGFVIPGFPSMGAWGHLWTGQHGRKPSVVRRHAGRARFRPQRAGQSLGGILAGGAPGNNDPGWTHESDS